MWWRNAILVILSRPEGLALYDVNRLTPTIMARCCAMGDEPTKPTVASPIELDLSAIEDLADGDPAVEADLIAMFVRHTIEGIAKVRAAIGADQLAEAAGIAHTCIGFTATIGIAVLVPTLRELARAIRDEQGQEITRLLAQWEREFEQVREALHARILPPGAI
jgi:hypothetical protein